MVEGPTLTLSEEERMRAEGAPELFDYAVETKNLPSRNDGPIQNGIVSELD